MIEHFYIYVEHLSPLYVYFALLIITFSENIFPPLPSDTMVVVISSLVLKGTIKLGLTLTITTIGSEAGFLLLFFIGGQVDKKVFHSGRFKFISVEILDKAEAWFNQYGYGAHVFNRFIPGIRAGFSFFSGMSHLNFVYVFIFSTLGALLWNIFLVSLGHYLGKNVLAIDHLLDTYTRAVLTLLAITILIFVLRYYLKKRKSKN
jgi:membrane protein DedA with SNARE-associated domain